MTQAIIFDCDGVLVDSEVLAQEVELAALAEVGLAYDRADFQARFMGMSNDSFFAALEADSRKQLGRALPANFRESCHNRYAGFVRERLVEVPGAAAAIGLISHPRAVASSSEIPILETKLRKTGLWEYFAPHVYSADHVARSKPAPDLFLHAAAKLGAEARRCLVLEDSANGVLAARAAGMTVWGFMGGSHMDSAAGGRLLAAGAHRLIRDWAEAGALLSDLSVATR